MVAQTSKLPTRPVWGGSGSPGSSVRTLESLLSDSSSWSLALSNARRLELPRSASAEDIQQMIDGKLSKMGGSREMCK